MDPFSYCQHYVQGSLYLIYFSQNHVDAPLNQILTSLWIFQKKISTGFLFMNIWVSFFRSYLSYPFHYLKLLISYFVQPCYDWQLENNHFLNYETYYNFEMETSLSSWKNFFNENWNQGHFFWMIFLIFKSLYFKNPIQIYCSGWRIDFFYIITSKVLQIKEILFHCLTPHLFHLIIKFNLFLAQVL